MHQTQKLQKPKQLFTSKLSFFLFFPFHPFPFSPQPIRINIFEVSFIFALFQLFAISGLSFLFSCCSIN
jgi:hypothetical protein